MRPCMYVRIERKVVKVSGMSSNNHSNSHSNIQHFTPYYRSINTSSHTSNYALVHRSLALWT